ncbi:YjaG family protein [Aliiglaciecola litoralis]|uniref:YjaG family protein n=1 Tax=Aliiglaciecola litoralis TaxID=582857 RepID=A0ABN1LEI2_9ALTE
MNEKLNTFQRVRELKGWHAVAFATTLVQRMQPNFALFRDTTDYDDEGQFNKSLEALWQWLTPNSGKINFALQLDKVEEITPDAADYQSYGVYPAIDVTISLASTISLIMNEEPQGAVIVSKLSQGCVEAFVELVNEEPLESQQIKSHPLMEWEVAFQNELIDILATMRPSAQSVKQLRAMALSEGVSNIGIECT